MIFTYLDSTDMFVVIKGYPVVIPSYQLTGPPRVLGVATTGWERASSMRTNRLPQVTEPLAGVAGFPVGAPLAVLYLLEALL